MKKTSKRCALVLAGCGAKDGAEITEAVSLLISLSQHGFITKMFAANRPLYHVVDHLSDRVQESETRNILTEAARIARGKIAPLQSLKSEDFDILCFAGGFGVAKNYCDFAFAGKDAVLESDIKHVLFDFINAQKILAGLCISPVLLALAAKELKLSESKVTLGVESDVSRMIEAWGVKHEVTQVNEACVDTKNRFVTAPAYMDDNATAADIFASANALVNGVETLLSV